MTDSADPTKRPASSTVPSSHGERPELPADPSARVGKFVRVRLLGSGGMGEVWQAWDTQLARWVALKFLKGHDADEIARFRREAQTAAGLSHTNIAAVYEVGEDQGRHFIAMQYVEGMTFKHVPRQDARKLVRLLLDAVRGVAYAHELGIVHRDIKPENIMVDAKGRVFVMDFGLARSVAGERSVSGSVVGTPAYMAPEQARGERVDARADVWSLGATLYELVTDRQPFKGASVYEVLRLVEEAEPKACRVIDPRIDADLETIVLKCLEKDRTRRYGTAAELADDLDRWLAGEAISAHRPSYAYRLRKSFARRKAVVAAIALTIAVSGAFLTYWTLQRVEAREWARVAGQKAAAGEHEEAKRLLDQARPRIVVDERLYRSCVEALDRMRAAAESRRQEEEVFGPIFSGLTALVKDEAGMRRSLQLLDEGLARYAGSWQAWMRKGEFHAELGDHAAALDALARAAALNPRLAGAHWRRGMIFIEKLGRPDDAMEAFLHAQKADPDSDYAVVGQARVALLKGDLTRALELCDSLDGRDVRTADVIFIRAIVYGHDLGAFYRPKEAMRLYDQFLAWNPSHTLALHNRGLLLQSAGDFARAREDFSEAVRLRPGDPDLWAARAIVRQELGDLDGALADHDESIRLRPDCARYHFNRGRTLSQKGDDDGGLRAYAEAVRLDPRLAHAYYNIGNVHASRRNMAVAVDAFTSAIAADSKFVDAFVNRACVRIELSEFVGAMSDLNRAIELRPAHFGARFNRALVREATGDVAGTIVDLEAALAAAPADWPDRVEAEEKLKLARAKRDRK